MTEKERDYIRSVLRLALVCVLCWVLLYGLLRLFNGAQWMEIFNPLPYSGLAAVVSTLILLFYPERFEKRIWGAVCQEKRTLSFPLAFLRNLAFILLFRFLLGRLECFLTDLMIEHQYPSILRSDPDFSVAYREVRNRASLCLANSLAVLLVTLVPAFQVRQKLRLHREQEREEALPEETDG